MASNKPRPVRPRASFQSQGITQEMGKTRATIKCQCGAVKTCYLWAWSAHGYTICKGCGGEWLYDEFHNDVSKPKTTRRERAMIDSYKA